MALVVDIELNVLLGGILVQYQLRCVGIYQKKTINIGKFLYSQKQLTEQNIEWANMICWHEAFRRMVGTLRP